MDRVKHIDPKAIILSGGPNSVHEGTSPVLPAGFFEYTDSKELPVLGICYGMQLIAHTLGGKVEPSPSGGEFGRMSMKTEPQSTLFADEPSDTQTVWMSHGDDAVELPTGFVCAARSMQVCAWAPCVISCRNCDPRHTLNHAVEHPQWPATEASATRRCTRIGW